jgi:putative hemolysin
MKLFIFLFIISFNLQAACEQPFRVITEKDQEVIFCEALNLQLSQNCAQNPKACALYKDLKKKSVPQKILDYSVVGNPGSRICNSLGWKVHMAELYDESQVCTCLHPGGEYITCSSLSEYYRK